MRIFHTPVAHQSQYSCAPLVAATPSDMPALTAADPPDRTAPPRRDIFGCTITNICDKLHSINYVAAQRDTTVVLQQWFLTVSMTPKHRSTTYWALERNVSCELSSDQ